MAVVAYRDKPDAPVRPAEVTASSNLLGYCDELNFPPEQLCDGDPNTYWSSAHVMPTMVKPVTLTFRYHEELAAGELRIVPVGDHGPRRCELQASADGKNFMLIRPFEMEKGARHAYGLMAHSRGGRGAVITAPAPPKPAISAW